MNRPSCPYLALLSSLLSLVGCTGDSASQTSTEAETSSAEASSATSETDSSSAEAESDTQTPPDLGPGEDPNLDIPPPDAEGCHAIYAQDHFPEFHLVVQDIVWDKLQYYWDNGELLEDDPDEDAKEYLPLEVFRYQHPGYDEIEIYDAEIRLRGNETNWDPLPGDKMQFQIGFHVNDPETGNFLGLERILFDAATFNRTMMRDRLALQILRDVGVPAPCANNARVYVDVEYLDPAEEAESGAEFFYGVFTNIEKLDETYLERAWADPSGDLWKRASWELKTNVETSTDTRLDALEAAMTLATVETYLDLEAALRLFAADAALPDSDGPWAGGLNYYLYDDPSSGKFQLLPWDLDNTFDRFDDTEPGGAYPPNPDPIVWEKANTWGRPWFDLPLEDPIWHAYFIDMMREVVDLGYQPDILHARIDDYDAQIRDAVHADAYKPYPNDTYDYKVEQLHDHIQDQYEFLEQWLACWEGGGTPDAEGYCVP